MGKNVLLIIFIFIIYVMSFSSCSQPDLPLSERLQNALDENLRNYHVKGTSVAIIMAGGELWPGVSGVSHDTVKIRPDMYFAIGSITKNIVAALTFKLAEQGILSLDDSLFKWLSSYPKVDNTITILQLLHQRLRAVSSFN